MGLFLNIFLRGALFSRRPMHGATTIGAFDRDVARGAGVAIPTSAFPLCLRGVGVVDINGNLGMAPVKLAH